MLMMTDGVGRWDCVVRVSHWSIGLLFYVNYFLTESGEWWHRKIGWAILALLAIRLIWGLSFARGPNRLRAFVPTVAGFREHWRDWRDRRPPATVGHNAFGALAVYVMWSGLAAAVLSGWLQETDWGIEHDVDDWHSGIVETLFWLTLVHIAAVILTSWRLRRNLLRAMIRPPQ